MDRKQYSKRREENLRRVASDMIIEFQLRVLRGEISYASDRDKEKAVIRAFGDLPDKIATEYRRSLAYVPR